jgi:hypothetical protein
MANEAPTQFYSRDIGRIWRVAEALEYAIVGINEGVTSTEVAPFGGMKEKGIGREGLKYALTHWFRLAPTNPEGRSAAARPVDAWLVKGPLRALGGKVRIRVVRVGSV